jgi:hypothetical protein
MKNKYWWLKERHNPQLGVYWSCYGNISVAEAKRYEQPLYGTNYMHRFSSEEEYNRKIEELIKAGEKVQ